MKRIILLIFIIVLFIMSILTLTSVVRAAMEPPIKEFCEDQGYVFFTEEITTTTKGGQEFTTTKSYCTISDELTCDANDFYAYKCGKEHSKERPCVTERALVWPHGGDVCCNDMRPYLNPGVDGQTRCTKSSQMDKIVGEVEKTSKAGGMAIAIFIITIVLFLGFIVMRLVFRGLNRR